MAKAIFDRRFDFRRPGTRLAFTALPSEQPQSFPEDVISAAVKAGAAKRVPPKRAKRAEGPNTPGAATQATRATEGD